MSIDSAREAFREAVQTLCVGHGRINGRLTEAFSHHLARVNSESDLPLSVQGEFDSLIEQAGIKKVLWLDKGSIRDMSEEEASELANAVFSLYHRFLGLGS